MAARKAEAAPQSRALTVVEPDPVVTCKDCKHWDRRWPNANMAPCLYSGRFLSAPAMTTDMASCSFAEPR